MYRSLRTLGGMCAAIHCGATFVTIEYPFLFNPPPILPETEKQRPGSSAEELTVKEKLYSRHLLQAYAGRGNSFVLKNSVTDDVVFENSFAVIIGKPAVIRALDGFAVLKPMSLSHAENVVTIQEGTDDGSEVERQLEISLTQQVVEPVFSYHTLLPLKLEVELNEEEKITRITERVLLQQSVNLPFALKIVNGVLHLLHHPAGRPKHQGRGSPDYLTPILCSIQDANHERSLSCSRLELCIQASIITLLQNSFVQYRRRLETSDPIYILYPTSYLSHFCEKGVLSPHEPPSSPAAPMPNSIVKF